MAKPKNRANRDALLAAAERLFAAHGTAASTAAIAREAGLSSGTLFVYFESKAVLMNELYVALKTQAATAATAGITPEMPRRDQLHLMWDNWISWATEEPQHQRALAHLVVADELSEDSHRAAGQAYAGIAELLQTITASGPLRDAPLAFVTALMSAIANATIDDLITTPDPTGHRSDIAFDAMWRALAG